MAVFQNLKNWIPATFFHTSTLTLSPTKPQFFLPFRGLLRPRISHSSTLRNPVLFPFQEIASQPPFPLASPCVPPHQHPFQGISLGRFLWKIRGKLSKYSRFFNKFLLPWRYVWGWFEGTPGESLGEFLGQCQGILSPFLRRNPPRWGRFFWGMPGGFL